MTTIDLITGILGAGKTTFIRKYAANLLAQGKKIAILENDFGAVNVDRMMLQDLQSDRCKVEKEAVFCILWLINTQKQKDINSAKICNFLHQTKREADFFLKIRNRKLLFYFLNRLCTFFLQA